MGAARDAEVDAAAARGARLDRDVGVTGPQIVEQGVERARQCAAEPPAMSARL